MAGGRNRPCNSRCAPACRWPRWPARSTTSRSPRPRIGGGHVQWRSTCHEFRKHAAHPAPRIVPLVGGAGSRRLRGRTLPRRLPARRRRHRDGDGHGAERGHHPHRRPRGAVDAAGLDPARALGAVDRIAGRQRAGALPPGHRGLCRRRRRRAPLGGGTGDPASAGLGQARAAVERGGRRDPAARLPHPLPVVRARPAGGFRARPRLRRGRHPPTVRLRARPAVVPFDAPGGRPGHPDHGRPQPGRAGRRLPPGQGRRVAGVRG
jgi:hypothetical protein